MTTCCLVVLVVASVFWLLTPACGHGPMLCTLHVLHGLPRTTAGTGRVCCDGLALDRFYLAQRQACGGWCELAAASAFPFPSSFAFCTSKLRAGTELLIAIPWAYDALWPGGHSDAGPANDLNVLPL